MERSTNMSRFAAAAIQPLDRETVDDELVAAARAGDESAFAILFQRHRRAVTRLAYRFFYQREQVEDIVQESFANAYFALGAYRGGQEKSFVAWLSRITVRACYDALRRSRRVESAIGDLSEDEELFLSEKLRSAGKGSDIESAAISRDLAEKLLQRLVPEDRLILTLLNVADLSVAETAQLTGWSTSKVKMRAYRARKSLQRVLHRFV
jgi:RNA polymerase sigma-70 factor, ECF subfamily